MFDNSQFFSGAKGFYPLTIDQSLRFNDDDSAYLSRTPATAGNRKTWTISFWLKRGNISSIQGMFLAANPDNNNQLRFLFNADGSISLFNSASASINASVSTVALFRDPSSWYHIVLSVDTTQATSADRIKIYVNGVQAQLTVATAPALNLDMQVNAAALHKIGQGDFTSIRYLDGYLAEVHFTDGTAYTADAFGEFKSGVWVAKSPSVTYGTNGFHLDFANSADIGNDISGNGNDWTPNNFTASDVVLDSPTDNFATLNPLTASGNTLSDGNLVASTLAFVNKASVSTISATSGKWYAEMVITNDANGYGVIGIGEPTTTDWATGANTITWATATAAPTTFQSKGSWSYSNETWNQGDYYAENDIIGVAVDLDNDTIEFYQNGSSVGSADISRGDDEVAFLIANSSGSQNGAGTANFGQLGFTYTPPTGYLALSTANLPDPVIDPAQDASPEDYFGTTLYTGDGTTSRAITGVGFQPSLVWTKQRSGAVGHDLSDAVRGVGLSLFSESTSAEINTTNLASFDSDGYTINDGNRVNQSGVTFVSWAWKANGSGVTNTDGSITSTVSANTTSGFSIVSYTGTGSNATVGHGLDSAPDLIITKNRDTTNNWTTFHNLDTDIALFLNSTSASASGASFTAYWTNTAPTTSVFSVGTNANTNGSGNDMIAYAFHSVEGFSKFGSYTGNGSADGPFVYTGFRPAWVLIKRSGAAGDNWVIYDSARDTYNPTNQELYPNTSGAESSTKDIDFVSNGFKIRASGGLTNGTTITDYIYMAFAENPFKYSLAR